jgi:hypothetical protein
MIMNQLLEIIFNKLPLVRLEVFLLSSPTIFSNIQPYDIMITINGRKNVMKETNI